MAFRRTISISGTLITRRIQPSFLGVHCNGQDDSHCNTHDDSFNFCGDRVLVPSRYTSCNHYHCYTYGYSHPAIDARTRERERGALLFGTPMYRYMSSGGNPEKDLSSFEFDSIVGEVASRAPDVNEVAVAAADSALPVAALQHVIDFVHSFTGLNWWDSIALTTILIRSALIPVYLNQLKSTVKLSLMRPRMEELNQKLKETAMDADAVSKHQQRMMALFKECGVSPLTPLKGLLIQGPIFISFFLAIRNMVEKVPSFKTGGAFWYIDLTTPDSFYILPVLTALTFWITVECNMQEGLEGNPIAGTMKKFSRVLAVAIVPVTLSFPKAIFAYWLTSNLFSLTYGLVIRQSEVKKFLKIPELPLTPDAAPLSAFKDNGTEKPEPSLSTEPSKVASRKISAASVLRQRIRSLQKHIKARNKIKQR